jgi:hypothetical protein
MTTAFGLLSVSVALYLFVPDKKAAFNLMLIFAVLGGAGLFLTFAIFKNQSSSEEENAYLDGDGVAEKVITEESTPTSTTTPVMTKDPKVLDPEVTPFGLGIVIIVIGVIWNIFLLGATYDGINRLIHGGGIDVIPALISLPFALIGLGILGYGAYLLLASYNPKPILTLTPGTIPISEMATLTWEMDGKVESISELQITITGEERATYRRGTDTTTTTNVFYKNSVFVTTNSVQFARHSITFSLPNPTMYSWKGGNNEIVWKLNFKGDVPKWPDINLNYILTVVPPDSHPLSEAIYDDDEDDDYDIEDDADNSLTGDA